MPTPTDPASDTGARTAATTLAGLAAEYHEWQMATDPLMATYYGLPAHRDRLPDLSEEGQATARARVARIRADVADVPADVLSPTDTISRHMLLELTGHELAWIDDRWVEMAVDDFDLSPSAQLLYYLPRTTLADADHAEDHLRRLAGVGQYLDDALTRHRHGVSDGRTPTDRGVRAAISRTRLAAAKAPGESPLTAPFAGQSADIRQRAATTFREVVAPALQRYADGLAADVAPHGRADDRAGLCWLPDGEARYVAMLRYHTTLADPDPQVIHDTGRAVLADVHEEMARLGATVFGTSDLAQIAERLRTDPSVTYPSPEALVADAQAICDRAAGAAATAFGRLPVAPCVVKAIPPEEAAGSGAAFYQPPAEDRAHGTYWVNTLDPALSRHEAEVTAFHEATPGHHTQVALQMELDLPAFRRMGAFLSGFGEGWGLYTERLADELGLYTSDLSRLGMLAMDALRASRMVVDTGLHHLGWSRQKAVAFLADSAPISHQLVGAEVDRYLVLPGQAPSYMLGRREIQRLRGVAEQARGAAFSLSDFHDLVLSEGALPLSVLAENVYRWLAEQALADG